MNKPSLLLLFFLIALSGQAQRYTISGYISDKNSRERLINANVYENNTLQGTTANNYGFYSISLPKGEVQITASFIGYSPKQIMIDLQENTTINFELELKTDQLDEVTVVGNQINKVEETQMSMIEIPVQKLQKIPVIMGEADVLKVIQLLPGVQGGTEGTSGIYVRGGGPDQNLFLLDGVPVYNASHLLGFFSVFNPDAIKTVKLYKGGFPSRFGGRLSSVVDISMKDGNMQKLKGDVSIGLISSKLMLEGPIKKDQTSFMISARRTYLDVMAKPIITLINKIDGTDMNAGAFFHDYNLKVNHIFSDRSRLYLSGYFGKDKGFVGNKSTSNRVDAENNLIQYKYKDETSLKWGNTIGSARWNYLLTPKIFSNTTLTYSKYLFDVGSNFKATNITKNTFNEDIFRYYSGIEDITGKIDFDYFPTPRHSIKFGTAYTYHHFTPGAMRIQLESVVLTDSSGIAKDFANRKIYAHDFAAYFEDDITVTENFKINAGLHLSVFNVQNETFVRPQPRLSMRYKGGENWAMKASYTRMAQHVHLLTSSGISMPTDLWLPVTKNFAPPVSDQFVFGTAINFQHGINLTVEGFYKNMTNLIEYKEGASFMGNDTNWEEKVEKGIGWSYGAEILLEKTIGKTTGWIGYTWSKTERQFNNLNFGNPFPAKYDRRHDVSIAFTHQISKRIDISGTWVYGTGNAVTLALMEFPSMKIPYTNNYYSGRNLRDYGGRNNYRMPAYHRMDLGVNLHKEFKRGTRTWSFSLYNAYNNMNPFLLEWGMKNGNYIYNSVTGEMVLDGDPEVILEKLTIFPVIPSISYSFKF